MGKNKLSAGLDSGNGEGKKSKQNALKLGSSGARNNYADSFYTSIPDFLLTPGIDKIKLSSIHSSLLKPISDLLTENGFKKKSELKLEKGKFQKKRTYTDGRTEIGILYNPSYSEMGWQPILMSIDDPTQEILDLLDWLFTRSLILPKISQIEIAFDFYNEAPVILKEFLDRHLLLKYQRRPSFSIESTFYTSDCRKTSKGTRTYPKKIDGRKAVRLELVLNRRLIKALGLVLPLGSIDKIDFMKFISFKFLDLDRIISFLIRANKDDIDKLDKMDGISGQLIMREIESWVRSRFINDVPQNEKLMKHIEILKSKEQGISNYSRFLKDLIDFNERFKKALIGKRFIPTQKMK